MAYAKQDYDNTNRGSIFKNDRKEQDSHPDMKGSINVNGTDYWISAWKKTSKEGKNFLSLSVREKDTERQSSEPTRKAPAKAKPESDDLDW